MEPGGEEAVSALGFDVVLGQGIQVLLLLGFVVLTQPTLEEGGKVSSVVGYSSEFFVSAYLGQF